MDTVVSMLQAQIQAGALPGAVAVSGRGESPETVAVGVQDLESEAPMSPETLFVWDSLGKPLTAALALTCVADGIIDLDSRVDRWLPELSGPEVLTDPAKGLTSTVPASRPITVEDLLTLRGGLGFTTDFESPFTEALVTALEEGPHLRTLDREAYLSAAGHLPLAHQPGQGWTYNAGSTILGLMLERAADEPLDSLMAKRLLEPLEMEDTRWWVSPADLHRFAARYGSTGNPGTPLQLVDPPDGQHSVPPSFPDGAGGLIGTADDWLRFGRMLLDNGTSRGRQILPAPLVTAMMTNQLSPDQRRWAGFFLDPGEGWGYGGSVRADGSYGWAGGVGTYARVDPRRDQVDILMTQVALDGPGGSPVLNAFQETVT